ncbi:secretion protein HlyD [Ensifer adhaerens]|nr:secretion protein HlyD [Ensifer adhaerens]
MPSHKHHGRFPVRGTSAIIWLIAALVGSMVCWSYWALLEEVTIGAGKVIPSTKAQVVQSLEGGILQEMAVAEGDIVAAGQRLATLDDTRFRSNFEEAEKKIQALTAAAARLEAQISGRELNFPSLVANDENLKNRERALFESQRSAYTTARASIEKQLALSTRELNLTQPLVKKGAASEVEVIRLEQQVTEFKRKINELDDSYLVGAKENYTKTMAELDSLTSANKGRRDQLDRTLVTAPVRGIVKNIEVTTLGGVINPGGNILEIVPLEDKLLIETKINPRDIAFVRPGLPAVVKLTAYDSSIYGTLAGTVERISPDTLEDETDKRQVYYRVYVGTDSAALTAKDGQQHPIIPGMVATVEIKTGSKTVFDYLVKPLNKMREALRER